MEVYLWLAAVVFFLIMEVATVGLVSVWFAVGSLGAFIAALFGASFGVQIVLFVVLSGAVLFFVRPLAQKYVNTRKRPTNADRLIGMLCRVTEEINNVNGTGAVAADGKVWTARAADGSVIAAGTLVKPVSIEGVKLIVEPAEETSAVEN